MLCQEVQGRNHQQLRIFLTSHEHDGQVVEQLLFGPEAGLRGVEHAAAKPRLGPLLVPLAESLAAKSAGVTSSTPDQRGFELVLEGRH